MHKAFTLIELLAVMGIMGMLGIAATGGYKALIDGMQERGVCAAASGTLRAAKERAQVDRVRTVVYCYNRCIKPPDPSNEDDVGIVAGFMTAIRISGRVTYVEDDLLYDEFGDLDLCYEFSQNEQDCDSKRGHRLFQYNGDKSADMQYSIVSDVVYRNTDFLTLDFFSGGSTNLVTGAFKVLQLTDTGVKKPEWKIGDGYAFEFTELQLPNGYIFDAAIPQMQEGAIAGVKAVVFDPDEDDNSTLKIYTTKPDSSGKPVKNRKAGEAKADAKKNV